MIKLFNYLFIGASILSSTTKPNLNVVQKVYEQFTQDQIDRDLIPRYDFERQLPPYEDRSNIKITQYDFSRFLDFSINLDDYKADTYSTTFKIKRSTAFSIHIDVTMTNESGETFSLFSKDYLEMKPEETINVDVVMDFTKMKSWGKFEISCYRINDPEIKNLLAFYLSKPRVIQQLSQEVRVFWQASLKNGVLSNHEIRLEIYNLPPLIYEEYYLKVPVDKIYIRVFNRQSISYKKALVFIKDDYGYMKKAYDISDPRFEGYVGNTMGKNSIGYENLNLFSFNYSFYVDQRTHMMSKKKDDFEFSAPCTQFFMPKGKYEYYKEVDCLFYLEDVFYTGRDVIYPFKVSFLNENADERIVDSKSETLSDSIYQKFMKEELL